MDNDQPTMQSVADRVLSEFEGDDRPATVEMVARLYSTMFAQNEAMSLMFKLVMKSRPDLIFTDEVSEVRREITRSVTRLTDDLLRLHEGLGGNDG